MTTPALDGCPRCGSPMEAGFAVRWSGLSFAKARKFDHFMFIDEDLSRAGWRKYLPWKASYYRAYVCRRCKIYMADYGRSLNRHEANDLAARLR